MPLKNFKDALVFLLIAVITLVFTFPEIDPVFGPGVDLSLAWGYNYIFATDVNLGRDIIFPHGPLGFLMYPMATGNNLTTGFWAICVIRLVFFFTLFRLGSVINPAQWLVHAFIVLVLAQVIPFALLLSAVVASALLVFHFMPEDAGRFRKWCWLLVAIFFTALSLHVRAGCGIVSLTFLFSYFLLYLYLRRANLAAAFITPLICALLFVLSLVLFRFFIYGSLTGFFSYYYGLFQLSKESSAATALYPNNNWLLLGLAGLLFLLFPIITRKRNVWLVFVLFLLPLFATWKHAMTREDYDHLRGLFFFLLFFFALAVLVSDKVKKRSFIISGIVLLLVYRNISVTVNYYEKEHLLFGVNRFADWLNKRDVIARDTWNQSMNNGAPLRLPADMKTLLGKSTVDVYPWDLCFIPVNDLNWQPRVIPQNYASYSPWLDKQNADHFLSDKAPDFIIWQLIENPWGGFITGLDGRYAFNDEPQTMLNILDNYSKVASNNQVVVLKKTKADQLGDSKVIATEEAAWNTWIHVPAAEDGILRAKFEMQGTLWRSAKNFLYKDEEYSVEYKLENGVTYKFRFVPEIAVNGVWVNPLIMHPETNAMEPLVKEIRFTCSNYKAVKEKISIAWELTDIHSTGANDSLSATTKYAAAFGLFGKSAPSVEKTAKIHFFNDYEKEVNDFIVSGNAYSGNNSYLIKPDNYSPGLEVIIDTSLTNSEGPISISATAWMKTEADAKINLVITVENEKGVVFWEAVNSADFITEPDRWQPVFIKKNVTVKKGDKLKVFGWNVGKTNAWIDDMDIRVYGNKEILM